MKITVKTIDGKCEDFDVSEEVGWQKHGEKIVLPFLIQNPPPLYTLSRQQSKS